MVWRLLILLIGINSVVTWQRQFASWNCQTTSARFYFISNNSRNNIRITYFQETLGSSTAISFFSCMLHLKSKCKNLAHFTKCIHNEQLWNKDSRNILSLRYSFKTICWLKHYSKVIFPYISIFCCNTILKYLKPLKTSQIKQCYVRIADTDIGSTTFIHVF